MIFLLGVIASFKIIFSILLTFVLSMLSKDRKKSTKEKIFPDENLEPILLYYWHKFPH